MEKSLLALKNQHKLLYINYETYNAFACFYNLHVRKIAHNTYIKNSLFRLPEDESWNA